MLNLNDKGDLEDLGHLPNINEVLFVMDSVGFREKIKAKTPNCDLIGPTLKATSPSFYTAPSVHAMLRGCIPQPVTGTYWPYGRYSNAGENTLIPMSLAKRGYYTYMMSSNPITTNRKLETKTDVISYNPYFTVANDKDFSSISSERLVKWFLRYLQEPFFAFFLVCETHTPYLGRDKKNATQIEAIQVVDTAIGKLIKGLRAKGLKRKTRIIITSDHAEAWDKGATVNHGHNPRHLSKFNGMGKLPRLMEVFLVKGSI